MKEDRSNTAETAQNEKQYNPKSVNKAGAKSENSEACIQTCGTKKRNLSISSQIKTTHNKSEIGLKEKTCTVRRKDKSVKNTDVIPSIGAPLAEHILMKTF